MRTVLFILISVGFIQTELWAQKGPYHELLKSEINIERRNIVEKSLKLKDREAKLFWPVYDEYTRELNELRDRQFAIIQDYFDNYADLTKKKTSELLKSAMENQESKLELDRRYYSRFASEMSPKTAVAFFEINDQIELMVRLQIWSQMPLIKK
jgi:hypothetical protein